MRILDWFFYEGRNTLFSVGLALLKLRETQILEEKNAAQILMILKERSLDISKLMPVSFFFKNSFSRILFFFFEKGCL